jgi:hypothetical protein
MSKSLFWASVDYMKFVIVLYILLIIKCVCRIFQASYIYVNIHSDIYA